MLVSICTRNVYLVATNYCYNVLFTLVIIIIIIIIIIVVFVVVFGRKVLHCYGKKINKIQKKENKNNNYWQPSTHSVYKLPTVSIYHERFMKMLILVTHTSTHLFLLHHGILQCHPLANSP